MSASAIPPAAMTEAERLVDELVGPRPWLPPMEGWSDEVGARRARRWERLVVLVAPGLEAEEDAGS
jgi:hypothetical protein